MLIALSFEGLVQWRNHRALARQARNLLNEIRDNRTPLQSLPDNLSRVTEQLNRSADIAQTILDKKPVNGSLQLGFNLIDLPNTSRTTAEVTGAFAHMEYDEVAEFASVYDLQRNFIRVQQQHSMISLRPFRS